MPSITLYPKELDQANSTYYAISSSYPASAIVGKGTNNSGYGVGVNLARNTGAVTNAYFAFDVSEIPTNSKITSVTCAVAIYSSSYMTQRTTVRTIQLCKGLTGVGDKVDWSVEGGGTVIPEINNSGSWTRNDLNDLRVLVSMTRNSSNSTTNTYCYVRGIDLTINYEEGGGGDTPDEPVEEVRNFSYTGSAQSITLSEGKYKLECWGAQGGSYNNYLGGNGGYSEGILTLTQNTQLYIYVGGQPETNSSSRATTEGGFNGGGNGQNRYYSSTYTYGQGGGGASDIRIGQDDLYARVIVAGGGGGSASDNSTTKYGGGEYGGHGGASSSASYVAGQTAPSTSGYYKAGTFGEGASAYTSRNNYQMGSGGGGGGWYGGYAYNYAQDSQTALRGYNGGGSGYVYTKLTASDYPRGCLLNQTYYLEEARTVAGNESFPSVSGNTEIGHTENGFVRITKLKTEDETVLFLKLNNAIHGVDKVYIKKNGKYEEIDPTTLSPDTNYILIN